MRKVTDSTDIKRTVRGVLLCQCTIVLTGAGGLSGRYGPKVSPIPPTYVGNTCIYENHLANALTCDGAKEILVRYAFTINLVALKFHSPHMPQPLPKLWM